MTNDDSPTVYARDEIGLRPPKSSSKLRSTAGAFIHHSAGSWSDDAEQSKGLVRNIQRYHMDTKGWNDIGYSWLVDDAGNVFEGRGWGITGAHTKGYNSESHGYCYLGNAQDRPPSPEAVAALRWLVDEGERRYGEGYVQGHRDVSNTLCPGQHLAGVDWRGEKDPMRMAVAGLEAIVGCGDAADDDEVA